MADFLGEEMRARSVELRTRTHTIKSCQGKDLLSELYLDEPLLKLDLLDSAGKKIVGHAGIDACEQIFALQVR